MGKHDGEKVKRGALAGGRCVWGGRADCSHTPHTCESLVVCGLSWVDGWMKEKSDESQVCFEFCQELREGPMRLAPV